MWKTSQSIGRANANKIIRAILPCLSISLEYFQNISKNIPFENWGNSNMTHEDVVMYYYMNICLKNLLQNMSCFKNPPINMNPYNV
jgi:hypothetical protein